MTIERTHLTEPYGDSTLHYWELRGPRGAVSLSAVETPGPTHHETLARIGQIAPSAASLFAGAYVFDVMQSHLNRNNDGPWTCNRHGNTCVMEAFISNVALPIWQQAVAGGLTDEHVYNVMQPLFEFSYGQVSL